METPKVMRFSEDHEWVEVVENVATVGITYFAQEELGDIVFVELPEVGAELRMNQPFGSVESVKTVSELYAPISGTVIEVNESLADSPEFVNESPYEKAWMVKIEPTNVEELNNLMTAEQYDRMTKED